MFLLYFWQINDNDGIVDEEFANLYGEGEEKNNNNIHNNNTNQNNNTQTQQTQQPQQPQHTQTTEQKVDEEEEEEEEEEGKGRRGKTNIQHNIHTILHVNICRIIMQLHMIKLTVVCTFSFVCDSLCRKWRWNFHCFR